MAVAAFRPCSCLSVLAAFVGLRAERASALTTTATTKTNITEPSARTNLHALERLRPRHVLHATQLIRTRNIPHTAYDKVGPSKMDSVAAFDAKMSHVAPDPVPGGAVSWSGYSFAIGLLTGILLTVTLFGIGLKWGGLRACFDSQVRVKTSLQGPTAAEERQGRSKAGSTEEHAQPVHCNAEDESIEHYWPRCCVLMALLMIQSISSVIMASFHTLIERHASIVYFFTMLVGLGGNAGCQSVVLSVRKIAFGEVVSVRDQFCVGIMLSLLLAPLAYMRALVQGGVELSVCLAIAISAVFITVIATTLGTGLPILLHELKIDPAHSAPITQVAMDMIGTLVICVVGQLIVNM